MKTYNLRDIDDGLWRRLKVRAFSEGMSIRTVIVYLLTYYAENGLPSPETKKTRQDRKK